MLFAQFILNSVEIFFIQCAQYILLPVSMYESRTSPLHIATFSSDQFYATLNEHRTLLFPSYAPVISNPRSPPTPTTTTNWEIPGANRGFSRRF